MRGPCLIVLSFLMLIGLTGLGHALVGGQCPLCSGHEVKYCNIEIIPEIRLYNQEIIINITDIFQGVATPIKERSDLEIWFYNSSGEIEKLKFKTDTTGIIRFTPRIIGYYIVKVCNKAVLFYANTTCGDGICAGVENRKTCPKDCGKCGDGICDVNENLTACPKDCAACGDGICSPGETRYNCLKDCVMCGDGICDYVENRASCPADCPSGRVDDYCDGERDGICDPDCTAGKDPECVVTKNVTKTKVTAVGKGEASDPTPILIGIVVILTIIAVVWVILEVKSSKAPPKKEEPAVAKKPKEEKAEAPKGGFRVG